MKNLLTFTSASGTTQLRGYVNVALGLFVILVALFGVNAYNRNQMVTEVMATPRPLDPGQMPTPTEQVVAVVPPSEECLSNPADWTLTGNVSVPGSNLKGLSPQCVRDQLDKTAAWFYATSVLGYSRKDAANLFGFSSVPMDYQFDTGQITVLTDFKDRPQKVNVRFPNNNTDLSEWRIDASGMPAVEFTFSGCFRTSSMSGGRVVSWGDGHPVICQYFADFQTRYLVSDVNGTTLTISGSENVRRTMWFGYAGGGAWVFLGRASDWDVDLSRIPDRDVSSLNLIVMAEKYDVNPRPLPENWLAFTGQGFVDAFLMKLNQSDQD